MTQDIQTPEEPKFDQMFTYAKYWMLFVATMALFVLVGISYVVFKLLGYFGVLMV